MRNMAFLQDTQRFHQLISEEVGTTRIVGQCHQGLNHIFTAGEVTVVGFYAPDGDNDPGRYAVLGCDLFQGVAVLCQTLTTGLDTPVSDTAIQVHLIGFDKFSLVAIVVDHTLNRCDVHQGLIDDGIADACRSGFINEGLQPALKFKISLFA